MKRILLIAALGLMPAIALGQVTARTDFDPLAPVKLKKTNGLERPYGLGSSTASTLGSAIMSAQSAASSGEEVVVGPGTYSPSSSSVIGKTGVSYFFEPGCTISKSGGGTTNTIIGDAAGEITGTIGGHAKLVSSSTNTETGTCLSLVDTDTDCTIHLDSISNTGSPSSVFACSIGGGCDVKLFVRGTVSSTTYDAFIIDNYLGNVEIYADEILATDNPIEWSNGDVYVKARLLRSTASDGSGAVIMQGQNGTLTIDGATLTSASTDPNYDTIFGSGGAVCASNFYDCNIVGTVQLDNTGNVLFKNCTIDASALAGAPLTIASNNVTLMNCRVIMKSTESAWVAAGSAKTLNIVGTIAVTDETGANRLSAVDADVTLSYRGKAGDSLALGGTTPTAAGLAILDDADNTAQRTTLGLAIGTNVQAYDADLTTYAGITPGTIAISLLDDVTAANARSTIGCGTMSTQAASAVTITGGAIDNTPVGESTQAAGYFTSLQAGSGLSNSDAFTVTSHTLTGSNASNTMDLASTWNTSGSPTAILLNVTNTASGASAKLLDLQVGGTSMFKVNKDGSASIPATITVFISPDLDTTAMTTGDGKGVYYRVPSKFNGWNLTGVAAICNTASSSGTPTFQLRRKRAGSDVDMLSTKVTIDQNETDSKDATPAVINGSNDDLATGDRIYFDCDVAGTGCEGVAIEMTFTMP